MNETLSRAVRDLLWRVVGVAVGAIGYAAEAGFELEMRRVALRSAVKAAEGWRRHLVVSAGNSHTHL